MDVKVTIKIKNKNFFTQNFWLKMSRFCKSSFHNFFYKWNMFFMGTNKACKDVIMWDITTLLFFFIFILTFMSFFL